jgi:hypothetical protein
MQIALRDGVAVSVVEPEPWEALQHAVTVQPNDETAVHAASAGAAPEDHPAMHGQCGARTHDLLRVKQAL